MCDNVSLFSTGQKNQRKFITKQFVLFKGNLNLQFKKGISNKDKGRFVKNMKFQIKTILLNLNQIFCNNFSESHELKTPY